MPTAVGVNAAEVAVPLVTGRLFEVNTGVPEQVLLLGPKTEKLTVPTALDGETVAVSVMLVPIVTAAVALVAIAGLRRRLDRAGHQLVVAVADRLRH